jgi:formiminoglutamase
MEKIRLRRFETKLGERLHVLKSPDELENKLNEPGIKFVVFGISEDIGVLANRGVAGTSSAWQSFLTALLNMQSNDFLSGEEILLPGYFDFADMHLLIERNASDPEEKIEAYRHAVGMIDDEVEQIVKMIVAHGKIPVVIGGGHNNAYPLIKGAAKGLHKSGIIPLAQINCINLDAHADYRPSEGRHSGNAFRYAEEDGYLQKYCAVAVHENYLPQNVWMDIVNNPFLDVITYEDIFILQKRSFEDSVLHAIGFTDDSHTGVELDLDSIEGMLSSAITPCGIRPMHARQYLHLAGMHSKPAYLHICEGAAALADGRSDAGTGKMISYLVSDFVKAVSTAH